MINADGEIIVDQTTGYSKEDAVLLLLGIKLSEDAECAGISLDDILDAEKEQAEADYSNAKAEKHSDESIKTAFDNLTKADQLITKAAQYRRDITDEQAKKESALRLDESNRITINSFNRWAHEKYKLTPENKADSKQPTQDKPWLTIDPRDPKTSSAWFPPARYFARQLIKENANLLHDKKDLTKKIAKSLGDVGIYKRGGKEPPDPSTILKALSNVKLG
jgi:hypothetical protein